MQGRRKAVFRISKFVFRKWLRLPDSDPAKGACRGEVAKYACLLLLFAISLGSWAQASAKPAQTQSKQQTSGQQSRTSKQGTRTHRVVEESPLTAAEAAIEKQDYAQAEKLLRDAVAETPNDYRAWFDLGFVLNAAGNTQEAIEAYRKSVAAKPDLFESNLNLGLLLAKSGSPEAETYLRLATTLKPESHQEQGWARAWTALGRVFEKSDPQRAAEAFRAAAKFQANDPEPHIGAAMALEKMRQFTAAEAEYKLALGAYPKSSEAMAGLISIYAQTGRMAEAEGALRRFVALDPQNGKAHIQLGRVLSSLGKTDEAVAELQAGSQLLPGDVSATRALASVLMDSKKAAEAEALLRPLVQNSPNDAGLHHELGRALLYEGKSQDAQLELLNAVKLDPKLGDAYGDLALAANQNKDYVLTLQALEARSHLLDENPATYFLRATAYDHLRDVKQAAAFYRQFLAVANGKYPDQEWQARHRLVAIEPKR